MDSSASISAPAPLTVLARLRIDAELTKLARDRLNLKPGMPLYAIGTARIAGRIVALLRQRGVDASAADEAVSDDPNSPNYRYADTGYIADSRKEKAANQIRIAKEAGQLVQATSIDWNAIERNPRQAAELIVKSNLFGQVDWAGLETSGMDPAAGFLIDRVYASIAPAPADSPQSRKDYAVALTTIRSRLEGLKTVKEVRDVLAEILDELRGANLNESETADYAAIRAKLDELRAQIKALADPVDALYRDANSARSEVWPAERELETRKKRGWKIEPAHVQAVTKAEARAKSAWERWTEALLDKKAKSEPLEAEVAVLQKQAGEISKAARDRAEDSPLVRGWMSFGEKFLAVLKYRYTSGSTAFRSHVVNAENNKIKDWSWANKERTAVVRGAAKKEVTFQLLVADDFERVGGKALKIESTASLKTAFGLREVQSGNWVLKDPNSARFHVEQAGAAFSDLSDVLGIDAAHLGLGGRLGMAFGARGTGGKNAARAHYEPVHRVVNLTKMGGGGALGHELFHAFDNILPSIANGTAGAKNAFATSTPDLMPEGPLRTAFAELRKVLMTGEHRLPRTFEITDDDRLTARRNVDGHFTNSIGSAIKAAGNATDAVTAVDRLLGPRATTKKSIKTLNTWKQIAAAYYTPVGETSITIKVGRATSRYAYEAALLDDGEDGKYWSEDVELAARAFQSWLEDTLDGQGRRNDYLSAKADNKHYDGAKPFPEGDERKAINAAFDKLFVALRESKVFEKASANAELLDAIFGPAEVLDQPLLDSADAGAVGVTFKRAGAPWHASVFADSAEDAQRKVDGWIASGRIARAIDYVQSTGEAVLDSSDPGAALFVDLTARTVREMAPTGALARS